MFRKDFHHNLWVIHLPLMGALAGLIVRLFRLSITGYRTEDLVQGIFLFDFLLVIPLMAYLAGLSLFQKEDWVLVRTLPLSRHRILQLKILCGFFLIVTSITVNFAFFSLFYHASVSLREFLGFWFFVSLLFLAGCLTGLSARSIPHGIFVFLLSGLLASVPIYFTHLWEHFILSIMLIGPIILWTLALILILLLKLCLWVLNAFHDPFKPLKNGALAVVCLSGALLFLFGLNEGILRTCTSIDSLDDFETTWDIHYMKTHLLYTGKIDLPDWMEHLSDQLDLEMGGENVQTVLYDLGSGKITRLNRFDGIAGLDTSDDLEYIALVRYTLYDRDGLPEYPHQREYPSRIEVLDREGTRRYECTLDANQLQTFHPNHITWQPGTSKLTILRGLEIVLVDPVSGLEQEIPLPMEAFERDLPGGFSGHSIRYLDQNTLLYGRVFGDEGYRLFSVNPDKGIWTLVCKEGDVGKKYFRFGYRYPADQMTTPTKKNIYILPYLSEEGVKCRIFENQHIPNRFWFTQTDRGILFNRDSRITLIPWDSDDPLYDLPFPYQDSVWGITYGDTALIRSIKRGHNNAMTSCTYQLIDIPTGTIVRELITSHDCWLMDSWNSSGTAILRDSDDNGDVFKLVNLKERTMTELLKLPPRNDS